jgi:hypothetical protein
MRRLNRNDWRLGWVLLANSAVVVLQLTAPIRAHADQRALYEAMRTAVPAFSYWTELFRDPWVPILVAVLIAGAVAEVRRNALSPLLNLAPFAFWLVLAIRDPFYSKLLIAPLAAIIAVDVTFYVVAFRRTHAGGNLGFPSSV